MQIACIRDTCLEFNTEYADIVCLVDVGTRPYAPINFVFLQVSPSKITFLRAYVFVMTCLRINKDSVSKLRSLPYIMFSTGSCSMRYQTRYSHTRFSHR